jgi:hypothetical protein
MLTAQAARRRCRDRIRSWDTSRGPVDHAYAPEGGKVPSVRGDEREIDDCGDRGDLAVGWSPWRAVEGSRRNRMLTEAPGAPDLDL